jgi:cardiolipin synthase
VGKENKKDDGKLMKQIGYVVKRDWKTIPNILSYFRIILIPIFIWLYVKRENYNLAAIIIIISGISDVADGIIARKFNMVSDLGKALDPAADKLTQIAMFICLSFRYEAALILVCVIILKEITMLVFGLLVFKKAGTVNSAKWFGKATTFVVVATSFILVIFPTISDTIANTLLTVSIVMALFSYFMYTRYYLNIMKEIKKN